MAILGFKCRSTKKEFEGTRAKKFDGIRSSLRDQLNALDRAHLLNDLKIPPGNELEALKRDRKGQHSIRVNDQFRLCFVWTAAGPTDVECVDYH